jgi:hypothetical protein
VHHYLVEFYVPRRDEAALADAAMRASAACDALTNEGSHVRYLRTIFVPHDEICFHLYEAQAADAVDEASLRAQIAYERIVRAVSLDGSEAHLPTREGAAPTGGVGGGTGRVVSPLPA